MNEHYRFYIFLILNFRKIKLQISIIIFLFLLDYNMNMHIETILELIQKNENILSNLNTVNDLLRSNESLRKQTPVLFYSVMKQILNDKLDNPDDNNDNDDSLEIILKCLRNANATFKSNLTQDETEICRNLIKFQNENLNNSYTLLIMQYFFNLSQGKMFCLVFILIKKFFKFIYNYIR